MGNEDTILNDLSDNSVVDFEMSNNKKCCTVDGGNYLDLNKKEMFQLIEELKALAEGMEE